MKSRTVYPTKDSNPAYYSLVDLDWKSGDLLGFNNNNTDSPQSFLLALVKNLTPLTLFDKNKQGYNLKFLKNSNLSEDWFLQTSGSLVELLPPKHEDVNTSMANFVDIIPSCKYILPTKDKTFLITSAYSGLEAITEFFKKSQSLGEYAKLIKDERFVVSWDKARDFLYHTLPISRSFLPEAIKFY